MNGLKCRECGLVNLLNAEECHRCGVDLSGLGKADQVSVPVEDTFLARGVTQPTDQVPIDSDIGRKTHFWYRIYCGAMSFMYFCCILVGAVLIFVSSSDSNMPDAESNMLMGIVYATVGFVLMVIFLVGLFLPRKPYNWIYGIVMIALGMTSCCTWPATIPLLIFWVKSETQAYLGRT